MAKLTHKTEKVAVTPAQVSHIDSKVLDSKGRKIGLDIKTYETTYKAIQVDRQFGYDERAAGVYFELAVYNTRNGEIFGRARAFRAFTTAAERSAWLDKFIETV